MNRMSYLQTVKGVTYWGGPLPKRYYPHLWESRTHYELGIHDDCVQLWVQGEKRVHHSLTCELISSELCTGITHQLDLTEKPLAVWAGKNDSCGYILTTDMKQYIITFDSSQPKVKICSHIDLIPLDRYYDPQVYSFKLNPADHEPSACVVHTTGVSYADPRRQPMCYCSDLPFRNEYNRKRQETIEQFDKLIRQHSNHQ